MIVSSETTLSSRRRRRSAATADLNTGTVKGGGITRVGARGYFMNNSHVGHDCIVGNDVIFATSATLGGHCRSEYGDGERRRHHPGRRARIFHEQQSRWP